MKEEMFDGFFGGSPEFWIGKVVRIDQQKETSQGFSWGWSYKVRIFGTYSYSDNIDYKNNIIIDNFYTLIKNDNNLLQLIIETKKNINNLSKLLLKSFIRSKIAPLLGS